MPYAGKAFIAAYAIITLHIIFATLFALLRCHFDYYAFDYGFRHATFHGLKYSRAIRRRR